MEVESSNAVRQLSRGRGAGRGHRLWTGGCHRSRLSESPEVGGIVRAQMAEPHPQSSGSSAFLAGSQAAHDTLRTTCLPALGLVSVPDRLRTPGSPPAAPMLSGRWSGGVVLTKTALPPREDVADFFPHSVPSLPAGWQAKA